MMRRPLLSRRLAAFRDDEGGTASMELVIVLPVFLLLFIAAFESAMILTRQIMMERTLDQAVRVLRLAQGVITNAETVRQTMCQNTNMLPGCEELLTIDLQLINRTTYELPTDDEICANRGNDIVIQPDNTFEVGGDNEFLLIRTCLIVDRILPISGFGLNLARDDSGGVHMVASTIFVNEPN